MYSETLNFSPAHERGHLGSDAIAERGRALSAVMVRQVFRLHVHAASDAGNWHDCDAFIGGCIVTRRLGHQPGSLVLRASRSTYKRLRARSTAAAGP